MVYKSSDQLHFVFLKLSLSSNSPLSFYVTYGMVAMAVNSLSQIELITLQNVNRIEMDDKEKK